ncbi:putative tandem protein 2 [Amphidinium carterae]
MAKALVILAAALSLLVPSALALGKHGKRRGGGAMLLEKMNHYIQTKQGVGLTPAEKAEVFEIRYILDSDILPSVLASAADAQSRIDDLYQTVLDCQVQVTTGLQINREMWEQKLYKQKIVEECWYQEVTIIDEEKEVCDKYSEIRHTLQLPAIPPPDKDDNLLAYNYLKTMSEYFCSIPVTYEHTWEECRMVKQNHTETYRLCKDILEDYEETICGWNAELNETCTEYMGCWDDALAKYHEAVANLTDLQEDWESEMDAVQKLDCLWYWWNFSYDPCMPPNKTLVYECEEKPINYTNVTLITYEPPERRTCPPEESEDEQAIALPCSWEFMNSAMGYLGLPDNELDAMKEDCHACPM